MSRWLNRVNQGGWLYAALVLHLMNDTATGPHWVLVVLCWWLGQETGRQRVAWAMLCGLCLDLAGHQQLGLHLAICGSLAALSLIGGPWLFRNIIALPTMTMGFVAGHHVLSESIIRMVMRAESLPLETDLQTASLRGCLTGGVVLAMDILQRLFCRLWQSEHNHTVIPLQNQWLRLSEG